MTTKKPGKPGKSAKPGKKSGSEKRDLSLVVSNASVPAAHGGTYDIEFVNTKKAPEPPGPFSHATVIGPWVYTSGMGGLDPKTGEVVSDDVIEQTHQAIANVDAILAGAGCGLQDVVKVTLYLTDMADYGRVNAVYEQAMAPYKPARTCVAVSALPVRERMKLDTVAYKRGSS